MEFEVVVGRLLRLARLDTSVFDEVRMDPTATASSFLVVAAAAFAAGLGGWLWWVQEAEFDEGRVFVQSVILGSLFAIGLWIVWLFVVYVLLTQVFRERADLQQLIRTMGMAAAPLALSVLLLIPGINYGLGTDVYRAVLRPDHHSDPVGDHGRAGEGAPGQRRRLRGLGRRSHPAGRQPDLPGAGHLHHQRLLRPSPVGGLRGTTR